MRRRGPVLLGGAMATGPVVARAQPKAVPVIGFLGVGASGTSGSNTNVAALRQGLTETGYVEGQDLTIEYSWQEGRFDRIPALVADLVARRVDVIVAGSDPAARAAKTQRRRSQSSSSPAATRVEARFSRQPCPTRRQPYGRQLPRLLALNPKRLELLRQLVPRQG